jgi:hypothetical protein
MNNNISFNLIRPRERSPIYNLTLLAAINTRRLSYLAVEEHKKQINITALKNQIDSIIKKLTTPSFSSTYNV